MRIAGAQGGYRTPAEDDRFETVVHDVPVPREVEHAASVSRAALVLAGLTTLPWLVALYIEADTGVGGPAATFGLAGIALAVLQRWARTALVRVRVDRAGFVRGVGWLTLGYQALLAAALVGATFGELFESAPWVRLDRLGFFMAWSLPFGVAVGLAFVKAARRLREAGEPRSRIELPSAETAAEEALELEPAEPVAVRYRDSSR